MTNFNARSILTDDDYRRAAAALQHAGRNDSVGIEAIIQEAVDLNRVAHFAYAQAFFAMGLFPVLASEYGRACIDSYIAGVVAGDPDD